MPFSATFLAVWYSCKGKGEKAPQTPVSAAKSRRGHSCDYMAKPVRVAGKAEKPDGKSHRANDQRFTLYVFIMFPSLKS